MIDKSDQNTLATYSVLAALTPLIPIPFVDDLAKTYFRRQLVRALAANHAHAMSPQHVNALADEAGSGCLLGCLGTVLIYPVKFIFRKIFFFLELKRAADTASQTYCHGYLVACAFQEGWCAPAGPHQPAAVRAAIDAVLSQTDTSLVNRAARGAFSQSKGVLRGAVATLVGRLRSLAGRSSPEEVAQAIAAVEQQEEAQIEPIANRLQRALAELPAEHFEQLRARLKAMLNA